MRRRAAALAVVVLAALSGCADPSAQPADSRAAGTPTAEASSSAPARQDAAEERTEDAEPEEFTATERTGGPGDPAACTEDAEPEEFTATECTGGPGDPAACSEEAEPDP